MSEMVVAYESRTLNLNKSVFIIKYIIYLRTVRHVVWEKPFRPAKNEFQDDKYFSIYKTLRHMSKTQTTAVLTVSVKLRGPY